MSLGDSTLRTSHLHGLSGWRSLRWIEHCRSIVGSPAHPSGCCTTTATLNGTGFVTGGGGAAAAPLSIRLRSAAWRASASACAQAGRVSWALYHQSERADD